MKKILLLGVFISVFFIACSSKVQTYDSSIQKNEAAKAHKDLNNELKN